MSVDAEPCTNSNTPTDDSPSDSSVSCDDPPTCRPALPRMKSCLKSSPSHSGACTPTSDDDAKALSLMKKRVAFSEEGTEEVHEADEWDRTPAEIAQRLSYEDVLELKMIQRELPRAEQPFDPLSSRPYSGVFLAHVPIPLLPLNPVTVSASPSTVSPSTASPPCSPLRTPSPPPLSRGTNILATRDFSPPQPCTLASSSPPLSSSSIFAPHYGPTPPPPPQQLLPSDPSPQARSCQDTSQFNPTPDTLAIRPHNILVPPPPLPPRPTYPPPPSVRPGPTSNLPPPKRTFAFLPLLDDSSTNGTSAASTPVASDTGKSLTPSNPAPPPDTITPSSSSQSHQSDSDRSDLGYTSDCSVDASTPSLTTASLSSSSPPESPGVEYDFHIATERVHLGGNHTGPNVDAEDDESFVLNLDLDADVDPLDSYFPRVPPSMTMHPIHQGTRSCTGSNFTPTTPTDPTSLHTPQKPTSRVPISSFHSRHPHLHTMRPTHACNPSTSTPVKKLPVPGSDSNSIADPFVKLRLRSIPSPELDLPAPSPLELPARIGVTPMATTQKRMLVPLLPLVEPAPPIPLCVENDARGSSIDNRNKNVEEGARGVLLAPEEQGLMPSLSRSQVHPHHL